MKLIIGLGNPGDKYQDTWHNVGFLAIDYYLKTNGTDAKSKKKFSSEIYEIANPGEKLILAKPQAFMNNSGKAVADLANFFKIKPNDIWVIHDDIDLPLGKIRISQNATAAGHKGVQSIIDNLGSQEFVRFRIGIHPQTESKTPTEDYVLQKIGKDASIVIEKALEEIAGAIEVSLMDGVTAAMNEFN